MTGYNCPNCSRQGFPLKEMVRLMVCHHVWCFECVKFWIERYYDARDTAVTSVGRPFCPVCRVEFLEGVRHMRDIKIITQMLPLYSGVAVGMDFYAVCTIPSCPEYLVLNGNCNCIARARFSYNKALQLFEVFQ